MNRVEDFNRLKSWSLLLFFCEAFYQQSTIQCPMEDINDGTTAKKHENREAELCRIAVVSKFFPDMMSIGLALDLFGVMKREYYCDKLDYEKDEGNNEFTHRKGYCTTDKDNLFGNFGKYPFVLQLVRGSAQAFFLSQGTFFLAENFCDIYANDY